MVFQVLPFNTITRRIPECHLEVSNIFCPINERQTTISDVKGKIYYMYSSDEKFLELYDLYKVKHGLIYIRQETNYFSTHSDDDNFSLDNMK